MGTEHKKNTTVYVVSAVLIIIAFFGGMMYGKSSVSTGGNGSFAAGGGPGGNFGGRTRGGANGGAGITSGDILSMDNQSMTVQLRAGGSKIVFLSASTTVQKQTEGTRADLKVGTSVTAIGTPNSDGSITAQSVQIRPAGMPGGPAGQVRGQ